MIYFTNIVDFPVLINPH